LNNFLYNCGKFSSWSILKLFFGFNVQGKENIPQAGGFIIATNHQSNLDPLIVGAACKRIINFMAKEDLFKNRFFGWVLFNVGAFPIKRHSGDIAAIREAIKRLNRGYGLLIFPQGTRKQRQEIDVQPGIGLLAAKGKVAIVPAFITGSEQALPPGTKWLRSAKISVRIGKPISFEAQKPYPEIAHEVMQKINDLKFRQK
jgi:1-acyl-sn-glycerol-3-phosphate acyltransferase